MPVIDLLKFKWIKPVSHRNFNPKIRDWILPYWYEQQNDPRKSTYAVGDGFVNLTCRSWTAIRAKDAGEMVFVDRFGVINLPDLGISIETWIHTGEDLYTPGSYKKITQGLQPDTGCIETVADFETGICINRLLPLINPGREPIRMEINVSSRVEDALKQIAVYSVIRPFNHNGYSMIKRIEYKEHCLSINGLCLLLFEQEPKHCYFTNGEKGDVTEYFRHGEGNSMANSHDGICTGLIGYSGLPAELDLIHIFLITKHHWISKIGLLSESMLRNKSRPIGSKNIAKPLNPIQSGTRIDQMVAANLNYLEVFSSPLPNSIDIYQVLALNRFFHTARSRYFLKECLKRVRWDGSLSRRFLGPEKIIYAVTDYLKFSEDYRFIEIYWPVLKRVAYGLWYQKLKYFQSNDNEIFNRLTNPEGFYERYFWACASLKAIVELSRALGLIHETHLFKEQYFALWSRLLGLLADSGKADGLRTMPINIHGGMGGEIVRNLVSSYPLQLWDRRENYISDSINYISNKYLYQGGIFSPVDFRGIDLGLSARFGQVLIRENLNYTQVLKLLLTTAGTTWSWPDQINPLTMEGIGVNGHDPGVLHQVLLLIRSIFVIEEGVNLDLLPGLFISDFWEQPHIKIDRLATYFGVVTVNCISIGELIQIEFWPNYRQKPAKIRLHLNESYKPVYIDAKFTLKGLTLEIDPDFHLLRLKRMKSLGLS